MDTGPHNPAHTELADEVDAALQDLWRGSSARLEQLLDTDGAEGGGVGDVMDGLARGLDRILPHLNAGDEFGGMRIVRELGHGGMGVVYAAQQERPQRMVALKVLRPGLTSDSSLRRFEYEASLLSRLRHDGIAQIYGSGAAGTGEGAQPYFVMELVQGLPLVEYAADRNLTTTEKLTLFRKVCDAVQHAHQRGVIHRDLKPANVLVDNNGQPKILDFGVGRAIDVETLSMHTAAGQLVGTLPYMSPEQIGGDPDELDTRSDVYSLGVVLYELLTGRLPHDVRKLSLPDAVCRIRDDEPRAISTISGEFRGDLNTIVANAIAKDRDRRYLSAHSLSEDIRRYLQGEAIDAKRDSALYVLRKTLVRYRWPLAVPSSCVVLLAAFTAYALTQAHRYRTLAVRERQASENAVAARRSAEEQRLQAESEAARADAVKAFLQMMLVADNPTPADTRDVTVREVLDDAAARVESGALADQPEAEIEIHKTLARTYAHLGLYHAASSHYRWLHESCVRRLGESAGESLRALLELATNCFQAEDYGAAKTAFERCLELAAAEPGENQELALAAMDGLGGVLSRIGRADEAESLHLEAIEGVEQTLGTEHELYVSATFNLGADYLSRGRLEEAEQYYLKALESSQRLNGPDSYFTIRIRRGLAYDIYRRTDRMEEAEALLRDNLALARRELGAEHTETNIIVVSLSRLLRAMGKSAEAEQVLRDAVAGFSEIRAIENNDTLKVVGELAQALVARGDPQEAARVLRDGVDRAIAAHGDEHAHLADWIYFYGEVVASAGDFAAGVSAAKQALDIRERTLGSESAAVALAMQRIGWFSECAGDYASAVEWYRRALDLRRRISGETHKETIRSTITLASAMVIAGEDGRTATDMLRELLILSRAELGETHRYAQWTAWYLASLLSWTGRHSEAIALDREMLDLLTAKFGDNALETAAWWRHLGQHLLNNSQPAEAIDPCRRALAVYQENEKQETTAAIEAQRELAEVLIANGDFEEADRSARAALEATREIDGVQSLHISWCMIVLGEALVAEGKLNEAEQVLRESLSTLEQRPPRAVYYYALGGQARSALGQCLTAQGHYDEAEPLLLEGRRLLLAVEAPRRRNLRDACSRIVALYEAWGRHSEADRWRPMGER